MPRIPSEGTRTREPRLVGGAKETFLLVRGLDISAFNLSEDELNDAKSYIQQLKKDKLSPDQMAEQMWALREQLVRALKAAKEDGADKQTARLGQIQSDPELHFAAALYKVLSTDPAIVEKAGERLTRQTKERERINGTYIEYQKYHNELEEKEEALNKLLAYFFRERGKEPKPTFIVRRALLEARIDELEEMLKEVKKKNPYTAAQIEYEKILEYARQLRQYGFIWTDSRSRLMREVLTDALSSRPVVAFYGETGTGKTAMARAASLELTGREPERTVGGAEEQFVRLLATRTIRGDSTFWEFGPLLRAMTGLDSSMDEKPKRGGGIYFDDEFNTRPTSVQREILKFVAEARPGRKMAVPSTPLVIEVQPGFLYLAAGNPPSERYEREETSIETKREFAANVVNVGYLEQSKESPELYQVLLAALMNTETKRLSVVSSAEVAPRFFRDSTTGEEKLDAAEKNGGFLWRFAECWHELFMAFSHQSTVLHAADPSASPETYYLQEFILDPGVVISWIDKYKSSLKDIKGPLDDFFKDKLNKYINQFSPTDKETVIKYLDHFGLELATVTVKKPPFTALTPQEIGFLNPNVPRPRLGKQKPFEGLEEFSILDADGNDIFYVEEPLGDIAVSARFVRKAGSRAKMKEWVYVGRAEDGKAVMQDDRAIGYVLEEANLRRDYKEEKGREAGTFKYNEGEAKRLGLEPMSLKAYPEADRLIARVPDSYAGRDRININTQRGQDDFCLEWDRLLPALLPPCVPREEIWKKMKVFQGKPYPAAFSDEDKLKGNFWYLQQIKAGNVITNLNNVQKPDGTTGPNKLANPNFSEAEFLLVDDWKEKDYNASDANTAHVSPLLKELLGGGGSTVNIKREDIDTALWEGDPAVRRPTRRHKEILVKLGVDHTKYELRLIAQDEYARGSKNRDWGQSDLWTNFDHYFLEDGARYGLAGGYRGHGGPSRVVSSWRGAAYPHLAVRLVLSRKR